MEILTGILFTLLPLLGSSICKGIETGSVSVPLCIALAAVTFILYRIGKTNP